MIRGEHRGEAALAPGREPCLGLLGNMSRVVKERVAFSLAGCVDLRQPHPGGLPGRGRPLYRPKVHARSRSQNGHQEV
jgi:hypothetical protein